jgi:hypothetical protein
VADFFAQYEDEGGDAQYLSKAEKQALIDNATAFEVKAVAFQPEKGYKGSDRFLLTIDLDGETRLLSFGTGTVDSRDRMLGAMSKYLQTPDASSPKVRIEELESRGGNNPPQVIVPA